MKTAVAPGWVIFNPKMTLLSAFWLDGFPGVDDQEKHAASPIYTALSGNGFLGIGQYVNVTHDAAAVVVLEGTLKAGGEFVLWVSPGAGRLPYRLPFNEPRPLPANSYHEDYDREFGEALNEASMLIGADA